MLYEIICDQFKVKRIEFHQHLNTVLGDDVGTNSIGKSTFLMIIDFVFGGKDYILKSTDVQRNVGSHIIKYSFSFDHKRYFFLRTTDNLEEVSVCDENYKVLNNISLQNYNELLKGYYAIELSDISFRDIVGRYSRIYGKENLNEKRPLDIVYNESAGNPINSLLKLCNLYNVISDLELLLKKSDAELKTFKNAIKYNFISSIGSRQYKKNLKELEAFLNEKEKIALDLDSNLLDMDSIKVEEVIKLKQQLSITKRQKSRYYSQYSIIDSNLKETTSIKSEQFEDLLNFFPNINTENIMQIETFHKEITKVLKSELKNKHEELYQLISVCESEIDSIEKNIKKIVNTPNLSKTILEKYTQLQKKIEKLESENGSFLKLTDLKTAKDDAENRRDKMKQEQLNQLQNNINKKMQEINDYIYSEKLKSPILTFHNNKYTFETPDDTGTGTQYKSMVVYDLSILETTLLPILIHDSVVLKQISDEAIEKILKKYESSKKQIFISLDKKTSYTKASQKILNDNIVLELSPNGNELFGRSWNKK